MASLINQRSNKRWSAFRATEVAEGFGNGEEATESERIEAFAFLIKTGLAWSLQGWYGRQAMDYINNGIIDEQGVIDWDAVDDLILA